PSSLSATIPPPALKHGDASRNDRIHSDFHHPSGFSYNRTKYDPRGWAEFTNCPTTIKNGTYASTACAMVLFWYINRSKRSNSKQRMNYHAQATYILLSTHLRQQPSRYTMVPCSWHVNCSAENRYYRRHAMLLSGRSSRGSGDLDLIPVESSPRPLFMPCLI
ncbi:unnamed protein product, partial [Ectocarpus sp. 12 AP-2014]